MKKKLKQMLAEIDLEAQYTASYTGKSKFNKRVMDAMARVDREKFVPIPLRSSAFGNWPLSIGYGQTISQPYMVACMTDLLELTPESNVLEIGTGSGYQAAIISNLAKNVYSIEKVTELHEASKKLLKQLGYNNIESRCGNGYYGWQEKAPFDAIIVTAAATHIPPALIKQLKSGGRMLIPIGLPHMHQELFLITKALDGTTKSESILDVAFVPLVIEDS